VYQAEYQKKIGTPVMHVPEQGGCRVKQHHQADRCVGVVNIVWNGQENTGPHAYHEQRQTDLSERGKGPYFF